MQKVLKLINMADVTSRRVNWLWYPYIPFGKLTIIQGDPGEGKTTFILHLAALLSKGEALPGSDSQQMPINIIYQTAEDGLEDTIKPRLEEAEADCSRILVIDETEESLCMTDERLEQAIQKTGARLVILDPIQAYLGASVDMHRANEIRPVMKRLGDIAEKYQCAIVLIGHMNKASGSKSTYRGLGSIDFQATARSVLVVGRIKDNPEIRVIAHDKSSLAPEGESVAFKLGEDGFCWQGHYEISVEELLSGGQHDSKLKKAENLLNDILSADSLCQSEIVQKAMAQDISKRVLDQAKKNLGVKSYKSGAKWYWKME
ncbi:AAA family ATPase [uncultured Robinsoniella sp.]|uniref:AAA family ATPase n=1 Tax=uncultured Robinsoniella sp. TaxID=904190 RepID=UPI00374F8DCB